MNIYDHAQEFKKKLEKQDVLTLEKIGLIYNHLLNRLRNKYEILAIKIQGEIYTKNQLLQLQAVKEAIEDTEKRIKDLHLKVSDTIIESEKIIANETINQAEITFNEIHKQLGDNVKFDKVNLNAFEKMIGFTTDGSPLTEILSKHSPYSEKDAIINVLRDGVLKGKNPKQIASDMVKLGYQDKAHALTVARTETMRVAHEVGIENFKKNGIEKVQWVSGKTGSTCAVCWGMDGKIFPVDNVPFDHPNGRCSLNPYNERLAEIDPDIYNSHTEEDFNKLTETEQKRVLGKARYDMWKQGKIKLSDLSTIKENEKWGKQVTLKNINDL